MENVRFESGDIVIVAIQPPHYPTTFELYGRILPTVGLMARLSYYDPERLSRGEEIILAGNITQNNFRTENIRLATPIERKAFESDIPHIDLIGDENFALETAIFEITHEIYQNDIDRKFKAGDIVVVERLRPPWGPNFYIERDGVDVSFPVVGYIAKLNFSQIISFQREGIAAIGENETLTNFVPGELRLANEEEIKAFESGIIHTSLITDKSLDSSRV